MEANWTETELRGAKLKDRRRMNGFLRTFMAVHNQPQLAQSANTGASRSKKPMPFFNSNTWSNDRRYVPIGLLPLFLLLTAVSAPAQTTQPHRTFKGPSRSVNPARILHDPGRVTLRRLNRAEYNNTVRDLCGVDIHPADSFPSDEVGYGFDNIGSVLSISPLLMEKYVSAAEQVAHAAFENPDDFLKPVRFLAPQLVYINRSERQNSFAGDHASLYATDSEAGVDYNFPASGLYALRAVAWQDRAGADPAKMQLKLDGKPLANLDVPNEPLDPRPYETRTLVLAGPHRLSAVFLNDFFDGSDPNNAQKTNRDRNLNVEAFEIVGPLRGETTSSVLGRRLDSLEASGLDRREVARRFLADFARRAYRRPVEKKEADRLLRYVDLAARQGEPFRRGIEYAITAILCSPNFLFHLENAPQTASLPAVRPARSGRRDRRKAAHPARAAQRKLSVDDYALAARLSYFLWSSLPDDELFDLAAHGKLSDPTILAIQARRMLKDPRAAALSDNFAGQWLQLRNLATVSPDPTRFPEFNNNLRGAMQTETELFFRSIVEEDRSVLDFLDARYTFLNETLARHYGIPGVHGEHFRRVPLTGDQRGGVLTQASLLTLTSNPTRTSPTRRGRWVMENLLGTPLPPAPPNVPPLVDDQKGPLIGTLRQRMEQHRTNPACAGCHARMDPIGFGLENFDAVGRWRTRDGDGPIDASGVLPDELKFDGPAQLRKILLGKKTAFVRCLVRKLLTYALGRGLDNEDEKTVTAIVRAGAARDERFSALVSAIVQSELFRAQ